VAKKKICICFDYENDKHYRYLLKALSDNSQSDISFVDLTPGEIASSNISVIKAALTKKIQDATHLLVIVGEHANSFHSDRDEIGVRNWQWWEINKAIELKKKLIAVKIDNGNTSPTPLLNSGASWAKSFTVKAILKAIDEE